MDLRLTIGLNEEALSALNNLTAAIRGISAPATTASNTVQSTDSEATGPIYWADNSTGLFGVVETVAEYNKQKKKAPGTYKIPDFKYGEMLSKQAEAEAEAANAAAEKKVAAAKKGAETKKAEKPATTKPTAVVEDAPSVEDVIAAFSAYLPKDLDKDERAARAGFVKPLLARFGAAKATELPAEHRALAINLVERKAAGEDVDPETDGFADADESLV